MIGAPYAVTADLLDHFKVSPCVQMDRKMLVGDVCGELKWCKECPAQPGIARLLQEGGFAGLQTVLRGSSGRKCPCHLLDVVSDFCVLLQVTLVCHGMTEVVPDKDGSDPYEVKYQVFCQHLTDRAWLWLCSWTERMHCRGGYLGTALAGDAAFHPPQG